jgi:hypothetical protein
MMTKAPLRIREYVVTIIANMRSSSQFDPKHAGYVSQRWGRLSRARSP